MLLALVLVVAQASAPTVPAAATAAPPTSYHTEIHARYEVLGTSGTLKLWFLPSGNLRGTYTPDDGGTGSSSVHGVVDGTKISLDFSALGGLHIEGTIVGGTIRGFGTKREGSKQWVLTGDILHDSSSSTRG
jgi:hypothetical protein